MSARSTMSDNNSARSTISDNNSDGEPSTDSDGKSSTETTTHEQEGLETQQVESPSSTGSLSSSHSRQERSKPSNGNKKSMQLRQRAGISQAERLTETTTTTYQQEGSATQQAKSPSSTGSLSSSHSQQDRSESSNGNEKPMQLRRRAGISQAERLTETTTTTYQQEGSATQQAKSPSSTGSLSSSHSRQDRSEPSSDDEKPMQLRRRTGISQAERSSRQTDNSDFNTGPSAHPGTINYIVHYHGVGPVAAAASSPPLAPQPAHGHPRYGPPMWWLVFLFLLMAYWVYRSPYIITWLHGLLHVVGFWVNGMMHAFALLDKMAQNADCIWTTWAPSRCLFGSDATHVVADAAAFIGSTLTAVPLALSGFASFFYTTVKPFNSSGVVEGLCFHENNVSARIYLDPKMIPMPFTLHECEATTTHMYRKLIDSALDQDTRNLILPPLETTQKRIHDVRLEFGTFESTFFHSINVMKMISQDVSRKFKRSASEYAAAQRSLIWRYFYNRENLAREVTGIVYTHTKALAHEYQEIRNAAIYLLGRLEGLEKSLNQTDTAVQTAFAGKDDQYHALVTSYFWSWFGIGDRQLIEDLDRNRIDLAMLRSIILMISKYVKNNKETFNQLLSDVMQLMLIIENNEVDFKLGLASGSGLGALIPGVRIEGDGTHRNDRGYGYSVLWDIELLGFYADAQIHSIQGLERKIQAHQDKEDAYIQRFAAKEREEVMQAQTDF